MANTHPLMDRLDPCSDDEAEDFPQGDLSIYLSITIYISIFNIVRQQFSSPSDLDKQVRAAFLGRPNVLESRCRFSLAENMIGPFCCCGMCVQCYIFSLSKPVALRPMYQILFGHIWPCGVQPFPA
jgi:hypothetical protein